MQNATQALIMAATILLGVLLMSTLVYMLRAGGNVNKAYDESQLNYQTQAFNYQYEIYQRDDNTVMDMVTLFNLAFTANEESSYNSHQSMIIVVKIGDKTFQFPKYIDTTNSETFFNNNNKVLERNQIYNTATGVMSVYDLLDKKIKDLDITGIGDNTDKLSKIHIGQYVYYPDRPAGDPDAGKPDIGENGTTYKYIFDCDDNSITYNRTTGRITKMEFECKINPYWELGSYYSYVGYTSAPEWDD